MTVSQRVGALCWAAVMPVFLVANVVVGLGWTDPAFSWAVHNVSDLGNVGCGVWDTSRPRYVCSPWHDVMNVALVLTAVLLVAGAVLTRLVSLRPRTGHWLLIVGSAGLGLAGLFPADVNENVHVLGAVLLFGCGNAALIVIGCGRGSRFRWPALGLGLLGVAGAVLHLRQQGLGLGVGGMERVAIFPMLVWVSWAGCALLLRAGMRRSADVERGGVRADR